MRITLQAAIDLLQNEHVVAVPTETVYGLAASLNSESAIGEVFKLKNRPSGNPLIIHVSAIEQIYKYTADLPPDFEKLGNAFWPGPMTIVLPIKKETIPFSVRAGLSTAGFRIPAHPLARELIDSTGPLVMPSANLSGRPSATTVEHVENDFGESFPVLDGGASKHGMESTILIYVEGCWRIIRLGSIPADSFKSVLGYIPKSSILSDNQQPLCPGQLYRHYAPKARLTLTKTIDKNFEGNILGYSNRHYPKSSKLFVLGPDDQPEIVAENLYAVLRSLDLQGVMAAHVDVNFPNEGLWITITERLNKAAAIHLD